MDSHKPWRGNESLVELKPVPPVPKDGTCIVCGKKRHPERSRRYGGVHAELDPFCCSAHARLWFENPLPPYPGSLKSDIIKP